MFAVWTGLEPATPAVTGQYSNQLNYHTMWLKECKDSFFNYLTKKFLKILKLLPSIYLYRVSFAFIEDKYIL